MSQHDAQVDPAKEPIFVLQKLYVKDLSLEVPHAPEIFLSAQEPEIEVQVQTSFKKLEEDFYDCSLSINLTAKLPEDGNKVVFINEAVQNGIFRIANIDQKDVDIILGVSCPNILFPYVRELVSSSTSRAGFPPVLLAPVNFDLMYHQQHSANDTGS